MKNNFLWLPLIGIVFLFSSCQSGSSARVVSKDQTLAHFDWSSETPSGVLTVKTLNVTPEASYHLIRLTGAEKLHIHKDHDLVVFILKGKAHMHFENEIKPVRPGDVIELARGVIHAAEQASQEPVEVYAVFTPPFDGKDHIEV